MTDKELYNAAYAAIGERTPLVIDCGELCGAACCYGGRKDGMLVFPGEDEMLRGFKRMKLKKADLRGELCHFALCRRGCLKHPERRELRPLSCRIFPLAPYFKDGELTVIPDPRARAVCPFAANVSEHENADPQFADAVKHAFEILLQRDGMREFLQKYSDMLDDYAKFW